jgi:hypothetical protein
MKAGSFFGSILAAVFTLASASDVLDLHKDDFSKMVPNEPLMLVECASELTS